MLHAAPPKLVNVSPDVVVRNEADNVDLFCEASATPLATLTWLKDGRHLSSSGHVTVAGNHVLLRGVRRSDAGVYSCTFKNVAGTASHLVKLVVQGQFTLTFHIPAHTSVLFVTLTSEGGTGVRRLARGLATVPKVHRGEFSGQRQE